MKTLKFEILIHLFEPSLEYSERIVLSSLSVARTVLSLEGSTLSSKGSKHRPIEAGLQPEFLEGAHVFVLPNPSGRNAHYSYQKMKDLFIELQTMSDQPS